ncbi:MAG TPA: hypothetical protein VH478_11005 [Trebonia sp.]|nr:hypothetical protein [Trebonia sp.]
MTAVAGVMAASLLLSGVTRHAPAAPKAAPAQPAATMKAGPPASAVPSGVPRSSSSPRPTASSSAWRTPA